MYGYMKYVQLHDLVGVCWAYVYKGYGQRIERIIAQSHHNDY